MCSVTGVEREQVRAFRLAGQHLTGPLPAGSLLEIAAGCGVQNTPPGTAALALRARLAALAPEEFDAADLPVFTTALLHDDGLDT
jgi:hypothetical protein